MPTRQKADDERKTCSINTRWDRNTFNVVTDEAWRRRTSASELVRDYVVAGLRGDGVLAQEPR